MRYESISPNKKYYRLAASILSTFLASVAANRSDRQSRVVPR